jgi:hypothetical protein
MSMNLNNSKEIFLCCDTFYTLEEYFNYNKSKAPK